MSYLQGLTGKDIIVSPLTVHKTFSYSGAVPTSITRGQITTFIADNDDDGEYLRFFKSLRQLYYGNYVNSTDGKIRDASLPQYNPDGTITGIVRNTIFENNISSIEELRKFKSNPTDRYRILSIPRHQIGDYIKPGSFSATFQFPGDIVGEVTDDGEGNIREADNTWVGNIIYSAGLITIIGSNRNGVGVGQVSDPSWKSSYTIYETQYKCTVGASHLNNSLNPSLLKSGSTEYKDFTTGSFFSPFVSTVGLYNDDKELLAVGKLSQPLPLPKEVDTTILVNIDR